MPVQRIAVLDDYQHVFPELLDWSRVGGDVDVTYFDDTITDIDQLVARLEPFDVIVANRERTPFRAELLERLPSLRLLVSTGPHNAAIDLDAVRRLGIVAAGTGNRLASAATIELAWALIFAVMRGIPAQDASMRAGKWQTDIGWVLHEKTLGIVGLGRLGSMMVPMARVLGMRTIAWSRNLTSERAAEIGVEAVSREEMFSTADVITIHLKLSERSRGYVGQEEIGLMKNTAFLVNTSRGPLVDMAALSRALHNGDIAGAALDVYDVEPLPADDPIRTLPRTVLTPHIGYVSRDSFADYAEGIVTAVAAFHRGEPVQLLT